MIPADLLEILRCPQTGQLLTSASPQQLAEINTRIREEAGEVRNQAGGIVEEVLSEGLVRADAGAVYPVWDGIPVLLADDAILLPLP